MSDTEPKSISEIDEQIAALRKERDIASLEGTKSIQKVFEDFNALDFAQALEDKLADVSPHSQAGMQALNTISIIRGSVDLIRTDAQRIENQINPPTPSPMMAPAPQGQ